MSFENHRERLCELGFAIYLQVWRFSLVDDANALWRGKQHSEHCTLTNENMRSNQNCGDFY